MPNENPANERKLTTASASTAVIVVALIVSVGGLAGPVAADHNDSQEAENLTMIPVDDAEGATVQPQDSEETCIPADEAPTKDNGDEDDDMNCDPYNGHMPGDTHASYQIYAGPGPMDEGENMTVIHATVHGEHNTQDFDFSKCAPTNARTAGFDRNNDDPGLQHDEDFLEHVEGTTENETLIFTDMFDEDDTVAGETTYLAPDDQIVAQVNDCYKNPDEPGWYQMYGWSNGTTADDREIQESVVSHYFYICNCTTEQQAVDELGPKPSADDGDGTPTPSPDGTPTPTTEGTPTATTDGTPTASPEGTTSVTDSTATGTDDSTSTGTDDGTASATGENDPGNSTPTEGQGPGFGVVASVVALLAAAGVAIRRTG